MASLGGPRTILGISRRYSLHKVCAAAAVLPAKRSEMFVIIGLNQVRLSTFKHTAKVATMPENAINIVRIRQRVRVRVGGGGSSKEDLRMFKGKCSSVQSRAQSKPEHRAQSPEPAHREPVEDTEGVRRLMSQRLWSQTHRRRLHP